MPSMDLLIRASLFLWITVGLVTVVKGVKLCNHWDENETDDIVGEFNHVFLKVCYEFYQERVTWKEAQYSCEKRGGKLLRAMDCKVKTFLQLFTKRGSLSGLSWWVGEGVLGIYQRPRISNERDGIPLSLCTYMALHPFQLVTTSNCNERRGYLCTLDLKFGSKFTRTKNNGHQNQNPNHIVKRATWSQSLDGMQANVNNIDQFLKATNDELLRMEQTPGEPTYQNTISYTSLLVDAIEKLALKHVLKAQSVLPSATVSHIINSTGAILLLSMKKCDHTWTKTQHKKVFDQIFEAYEVIALLMGGATEQPVVISHPTGSIYHHSYKVASLNKLVLETKEGVSVRFPPLSALQSQLGNLSVVNAQLATFSENLHLTGEPITGTLCRLVLFDHKSELHLANLTERFEINLPRSNASVSTTTLPLSDGSAAVISFNMSDPNQTVVLNVEPNRNVSLLLMLAPDSPPNHTHYSHMAVLQDTGYRWLITPEMMEGRTGLWYISASLYNTTWCPGLELQVTIFSSKCMYWDAGLNSWSIAGCAVGLRSRPELTQCLCNHLTFFGSSFFVMPNYVDLSRTAELFSTADHNHVVLALLAAFFGLYLLILLWACYSDKQAWKRRKMTLLEDSHPCARYSYLLRVQTGKRKQAGTSAKVTVKLKGSEGESEAHQLTDPDKPAVLERGAVDVFLLATPFPLGELQSLRLWHDNAGKHPSWYVDQVTVQDLQTHQVCHFLCSSWLSGDKGEGLTKKTFTPAKKNEITSFRSIFQSRTSSGFRDEHIWVSVVDPPWRSPFTRAQRVSCCVCLLLCTMAINIAFWNLPHDHQRPVLLKIGPLEITWQEIMVAVESGLLMFPINILIITIFRCIRPRLAKTYSKDTRKRTLRPRAVTIPTLLKDTEELVGLLSRSQRNQTPDLKESLQSGLDLCLALDSVHNILQLMQGESDGDRHWLFCSQFLLSCLHHLSSSLERLDPRTFSSAEEHQQVLSTTDLLLKKAEMVHASHLTAYCPPPVGERVGGSGCWLPWWFVFLGWFLLLSISGVSTFFTLLYGFQYGRDKSIQWVISLGLSLFQSIFILQPLKVIGLAVIFALLLRPVKVEENEEVELLLAEQQERREEYSGTQPH